jgi:hypothetical protein
MHSPDYNSDDYHYSKHDIAGARQIFHKNFFSFLQGKLPQEVKKKLYFEKFAGHLQ